MKQSNKIIVFFVVVFILAGSFFILKGKAGKSAMPVGAPPMNGQMGGPPPGMGGGDFQKEHQYTFQLMRLVINIGRMEEGNKQPLSQDQAKRIIDLLQPLREQKSLDEITAKDAIKKLQSILTDNQRSAISALPDERTFRRQGPPPSGAAQGPPAGSPPGMGGQEPDKGFNPLNPPAGGPDGGPGQDMTKLFDNLNTKSVGN